MKNILNMLTRPYLAVALLLMLGATAALLSSLPTSLGSLAPSPSKQIVYVSGHLGISIVDIHERRIVDRLPINGELRDLDLNLSGTHLYAHVITDTIPRNSLAVFDTANNQLLDTITLSETATTRIYDVAVNPQETRLFVTRREYQGGPNALQVIDIPSRSVVATLPLDGIGPWETEFSPLGDRAFILMRGNDGLESGLVFVDALNNNVIGSLAIGRYLGDIEVSPNGRQAYVSASEEAEIAVIDTTAMSVTARIIVGSDPQKLALSRDGSRLYVVSGADTLRAINTETNTVTDHILTSLGTDIGINVNGDRVFMSRGSGNDLWVVNTRQKRVEDVIQVDRAPWFVAVKP